MYLDFSIDDLAMVFRNRSSFHRYIKEDIATIKNQNLKRKDPRRSISQIRSIIGEYYRYIRTVVKEGKYHTNV